MLEGNSEVGNCEYVTRSQVERGAENFMFSFQSILREAPNMMPIYPSMAFCLTQDQFINLVMNEIIPPSQVKTRKVYSLTKQCNVF